MREDELNAEYAEPRAGRGTVFVSRYSRTQWMASWQEGANFRGVTGRKAEVLEWARMQLAAEHVLIDHTSGTHAPLPMSGPVNVGLPKRGERDPERVVYRDAELHNEGPGWFGRPPGET